MASVNEHLIAAYCFVNGIIKKLDYSWGEIRFVNSDVLGRVLASEELKLTDYDATYDLREAMVQDESQFTSHFGIILKVPRTEADISMILIGLTISYIFKSNDDIEFYVDNIKEPYTVHSKAIIKYIEMADINLDKPENIIFDLETTGNSENYYTNFYDLLALKIANQEYAEKPVWLNDEKLGRIRYLSESR
jgi:hypothetical protein